MGFVFGACAFAPASPAGTVSLGRPWRPHAKTAVLECRLGAHIAPAGFSPWNNRADWDKATFLEEGNTGPGAGDRTGPLSRSLDTAQAGELLVRARRACRPE